MSQPKQDHHAHTISLLGMGAMLTTLFAWTASPLLNKYFTGYLDVWNLNAWRYAMAALCWSPLIFWQIKKRALPRGIWKAALLPSAFNCVGQVAFAGAFYFTSATTVAFALRVQLISVAVGGAIFFAAERRVVRDPRFLIGMALVAVGVIGYLVLTPGYIPSTILSLSGNADTAALLYGTGDDTTTLLKGFALGALGGALFGGYALAVRPMMKNTSPLLSYAVISAYTAAVMVILMLIFSKDHGTGAINDLSPGLFALLVASAFVALVIGHPCYYTAIRSIGVSATAAVLQLQPITVGIASLFIFGTATTIPQWIAGLVAITSAIFMLRVQHQLGKTDRDNAESTGEALDTPTPPLGTAPVIADDTLSKEIA